MTAARQPGKSQWALFGLLALGFGLICAPLAAQAEVPTVVNVNTGIAISGFDPVAYFSDGGPKAGRPELELSQGGAVWRFINEGNRAEFAAHPDIYTPRFGGYDPVAIARGTSVPGHPLFWAIVTERLYLFYSAEARAAFVADPGRLIEAAERKWPDVARALAR